MLEGNNGPFMYVKSHLKTQYFQVKDTCYTFTGERFFFFSEYKSGDF